MEYENYKIETALGIIRTRKIPNNWIREADSRDNWKSQKEAYVR